MKTELLTRWTTWVVQHAWLVLSILGIMTAGAAWIAVTQFHMNSDTSRLIRQDTDWSRTHDAFVAAFPQYNQNTFVVVSGPGPDKVRQVTAGLADILETQTDIFSNVYSPGTSEFADANALLFLSADELNDTVSKLADAQPFLSAISGHRTVAPALDLMISAVTSSEELPEGFVQMADALNLAGIQALNGNNTPIAWRDQLFKIKGDRLFYQVIFIQGNQDFGIDRPNAMIIARLDQTLSGYTHPYRDSVDIRLTGQVPLEHFEIQSAMDSAQLAGSLALIILIAVLAWGVRSLRIIAAIYLSMLVGLIWTAAFAMLTVGQYNTISIIFLVMFIGLGVDFAVHICLRYQELRCTLGKPAALIETGTTLGPAIALCGVTSAIGFLAFVPTDYTGLGEMGIISAGGMVIAVVISLTLIPAFFAVVDDPVKPSRVSVAERLTSALAKYPKNTAYVTLGLAALFTLTAGQATFDYSTLSLKDPHSEAMTTLRELQEEGIVTDYALSWVANDLEEAERRREQLLALSIVGEVKTPRQYLPEDQEEKAFILEDAVFLLGALLLTPGTSIAGSTESLEDKDVGNTYGRSPERLPELSSELSRELSSELSSELTPSLEKLIEGIETRDTDTRLSPELTTSLEALAQTLSALVDAGANVQTKWNELIVPPMQSEIAWIKTALDTKTLTLSDLPSTMRDRLVGADNSALVSITPAVDIVPVESLRSFTEQVLDIVPEATGRPVLDLGIGTIVIGAFTTAISIAVACIFLILIVTLKSVVDSILVFIPLIMTAMVTLSVSAFIDLPLNMANVVVIPLIFGLGVDNGIHIVKRFHQSRSVQELVSSSTPKAVFLSNLTTLGTFCALSLSTHQGIFSMGVLLTVALTSLMLLTLVSLPALLATFSTTKMPRNA